MSHQNDLHGIELFPLHRKLDFQLFNLLFNVRIRFKLLIHYRFTEIVQPRVQNAFASMLHEWLQTVRKVSVIVEYKVHYQLIR